MFTELTERTLTTRPLFNGNSQMPEFPFHISQQRVMVGKLFFYTEFVKLHRWVCPHVRHFHLLS